MKTFSLTLTLSAIAALAILASAPRKAQAGEWTQQTAMRSDESPQEAVLQRHMRRLQKQLPVGHTESFYRDRLADRGWRITAVNQDEPMYIEYEIVRGDLTAEVQMKLDRETDQTIQVAVLENPILRESTEMALARNRQMAQLAETADEEIEMRPWGEATQGPSPSHFPRFAQTQYHQFEPWGKDKGRHRSFSDRDRIRIDQAMEDLASLPLGKHREFYRSALEQQGYEILGTRTGPSNHVHYKAIKAQQPVVLTVVFNEDMDESVAFSAVPERRMKKRRASMVVEKGSQSWDSSTREQLAQQSSQSALGQQESDAN